MRGRNTLVIIFTICVAWSAVGWSQVPQGQHLGGAKTYLGYPDSAFAESNPFGVRPVAYQQEMPPVPTPAEPVPMPPAVAGPPSAASPSDRMAPPEVLVPEVAPDAVPQVSMATCPTSCRETYLQQFFFRGWVDQGFTANPADPADHFNSPQGFNDRANEYQMNQLYLSMGRAVRQDCCWDIGGRVDLLFGTDYRFTQALGLETHRSSLTDNKWNGSSGPFPSNQALYGLAMPQLYAEVYTPLGPGVSVKMGHFYTIMGYESVMAPKNFFYSHSYSMMYGEPFTHTGMLASWEMGEQLTGHAGFTRGWDTWESYPGNDALSFLGGVQWVSRDECTSVGFTLTSGDEPIFATSGSGSIVGATNATAYSLVLTHRFTPRLQYVIQHDLGVHNDAAFDLSAGTRPDAAWYSINQYFFYQLTERLALGVRAEWFRDDKNSRVLKYPSVTEITGDDYSQVTLGLQWKPRQCFTLRSEARWDWSGVEGTTFPWEFGGMFDSKSKKEQFTASIDAILVF